MVNKVRHTELGDIPVDWKIQTFEETFRMLSNNTLSRDNLNNRGGVVRKKVKTTDQIRCIICDNKAKKEIGTMYYVPDGTKKCGYYECKKCGNRFLSLQTMEKIPCPDCEAEIDYEIGPDESMEDILDTAQLLQKIEGEEEVEKMDALLSLAITGGDCNWI